MPFRYSLNSSTIKPTPLLRKIEVAAEAGYEGIELWHDDIDAYLSEGGSLAELKSRLEAAGLSVPTTIFLKGWWDTEGDEYETKMTEIRRRLEQAAAVGAPFSVAGPPHEPVDLDVGAARYAALLDVGKEYGVRPAFEYLGFAQQVNTVEVALDVIARCGHPDACIVLDPFHCFRGGGGIAAVADVPAEQIAVSHFNDAPADPPRETQRDPHRVMPGDGIIDLAGYCNNLRKAGYGDGWVSLELFREDLWRRDPLEVAREGLAAMKNACENE